MGSLNRILSQKCSDHKDTKEIVRIFLLLQGLRKDLFCLSFGQAKISMKNFQF